jgi:hypothetical protein
MACMCFWAASEVAHDETSPALYVRNLGLVRLRVRYVPQPSWALFGVSQATTPRQSRLRCHAASPSAGQYRPCLPLYRRYPLLRLLRLLPVVHISDLAPPSDRADTREIAGRGWALGLRHLHQCELAPPRHLCEDSDA